MLPLKISPLDFVFIIMNLLASIFDCKCNQAGYIRVDLESGKRLSQVHRVDLKSGQRESLPLCSLSCRREPTCEAFTFDELDGACSIYNKVLVENDPTVSTI